MSVVFTLATTPHWCKVQETAAIVDECEYMNISTSCHDLLKNITIPKKRTDNTCGSDWTFSSCSRYDINTTTILELLTSEVPDTNRSIDIIKCNHGWEYDRSQYTSTVIQEFNLVCDRDFMGPLEMSISQLGMLLGYMFTGLLSDSKGRLFVITIASIMLAVFGSLQVVATNFPLHAVLRLLTGAVLPCIYGQGLVYITELVGPSKRAFASMTFNVCYAAGYTVLALLAYIIRDWKILQLTISAPAIISIIYWWILPESPRWLLSVGKTERAKRIIKKIAKMNGVVLSEGEMDFDRDTLTDAKGCNSISPITKPSFPGNVIDIMCLQNMRKISLILYLNGIAISMAYYGLSYNTTNLGGNDYINTAIAGAVEIPAYFASMFLIETRLGRKLTYCIFCMFAGMASICSAFIPKCGTFLWISTAVTMTGKFAITIAYSLVYLYAAELFPTTSRSLGVSLTGVFGMTGSILSPVILQMRKTWNPLPPLVFGIFTIVAGVLVLLLPETRGRKLPETMKETEANGK
ncbi:organic cation transporter protein-like [Saccoglossus kowalevskii]|uniref:Organic cation transporter protein-like n=1 Tax=Saccoglossus kowalevskii TaxID=10224 RepID=A0ABM0MVT8_SACKO|nr:PREDICTED: organic cation transporter protein-like [Saccoglossus kowalevskii]